MQLIINSVKSAGKLHEPARSLVFPYNWLKEPTPACSSFVIGVEPEWDPRPPNCKACEIVVKQLERQRGLGEEGQTKMDLE